MCGYELLFGGEVLLFLLAVFDFCVEFIGFLYAKIFQTPKGIDTTNNIGVITKRNIFLETPLADSCLGKTAKGKNSQQRIKYSIANGSFIE